jgi:hypothetical protein
MIPGPLIVFALLLGYLVAVALMMAATFGVTAVAPEFVVKNYRFRIRYNIVQSLIWLVCVTAGSYVTAVISGGYPWIVGPLLAATLLAVLWGNALERQQRGIASQLAMSVIAIAAVAAGYLIRSR